MSNLFLIESNIMGFVVDINSAYCIPGIVYFLF